MAGATASDEADKGPRVPFRFRPGPRYDLCSVAEDDAVWVAGRGRGSETGATTRPATMQDVQISMAIVTLRRTRER